MLCLLKGLDLIFDIQNDEDIFICLKKPVPPLKFQSVFHHRHHAINMGNMCSLFLLFLCLLPLLLHLFLLLFLFHLFQFHPFLQSSHFYNSSMDGVHLDENSNVTADLKILSSMIFPNGSIMRKKFGSLKREGSLDLKLFIEQDGTTLFSLLNKVRDKRF